MNALELKSLIYPAQVISGETPKKKKKKKKFTQPPYLLPICNHKLYDLRVVFFLNVKLINEKNNTI